MRKEKIQFGSKTIEFSLVFQDRKTLGIVVKPDKSVLVKAPKNASKERIYEKVRKRAPWILKQQSFFLSFEPLTPPKRYVNGETHLYLGKRYRLKIIKNEKQKVQLKGKYLYAFTAGNGDASKIVEQWYDEHAQHKIREYAEPIIERFSKYGIQPKLIEIRKMPKRWGSCSPRGRILLNSELIKAPKGCIEYVIIHELCHLKYPNHSKAFLDLQTREMPDWEKWKDRLERFLS